MPEGRAGSGFDEYQSDRRADAKHLDMQFGRSHFLANDKQYAIGTYIGRNYCSWMYCHLTISNSGPDGVAIEITDPETLRIRSILYGGGSQSLNHPSGMLQLNGFCGCMNIPAGISIGSMTGGFGLGETILADFRVNEMRELVFSNKKPFGERVADLLNKLS